MSSTGPNRCAYCENSKTPLSNEHLWPESLHQRRVDVEQKRWEMWTARVNKDLPTQYKIGDVCRGCNNGFLSKLDTYVCELFDLYFERILERGESVSFKFDYHRLKRWLLKMSFNSARLNKADDADIVFPPLIRYIRGEAEADGRSVQLFVELTPPGAVPAEYLSDGATLEDHVFRPAGHRAGRMVLRAPDGRMKLLRAVHLRSYAFMLAFFEPEASSTTRNEFASEFCKVKSVTLLRPSVPCVDLVCNGMDAWNSLVGARENRIVSRS